MFLWEKGKLNRIFLDKGEVLKTRIYVYSLFLSSMKYIYGSDKCERYVMYPDVVEPCKMEVDRAFILKHGKQGKIKFIIKMAWANKHKITINKIKNNIINIINYKILKK